MNKTDELSLRLKSIADLITPGNRMADIGTDHAFLPIYLVKNHICPSALAMDLRKGPLSIAEEHIKDAGLSDRIETRLSDGLNDYKPGETETIVIAGMGGDLIADILKRGSQAGSLSEKPELVLSPHTKAYEVRKELCNIGYRITEETVLKDDGKYYILIKANVSDENPVLSEEQLQYGPELIKKKDPLFLEYLNRQLEIKKDILERMPLENKERTEELKHDISVIEEVLRG